MAKVFPYTPDQHQSVTDSVELAFRGIDFEPLPDRDPAQRTEPVQEDSARILSGSGRLKYGYDAASGSYVHVTEVYVRTEYKGREAGEHRLVGWWDNGDFFEYHLDDAGMFIENDSEDRETRMTELHRKMMQALNTLLAD